MTAPGQRRLSIWAVLAVVVALVAAHCITGFAVYGTGGRRGGGARLLQVGSLTLSDAPAPMVQQAVKQKWSSELEPTERSLEEQGEAMLAAMRATARLSAEVAAVKKAEQRAKAPAPREPLSQQLRPPTSGQQPTILLQVGDKTGAGISALGVGVRSFSHFEAAGRGQGDDYFQSRFRYGGGAGITQQLAAMHHEAEQAAAQQTETAEETHMEARMHKVASVRTGSHPRRPGAGASVRGRGGSQVHVMTARKQQSLLQPNVYPAVGYPFEQTSIDTANSNGPAKTFDTPPHVTCPAFIPNCKPQYNTLTECDFSCGSYCQAIRGDGPCLSGDAEGEGRDCKFGYRGARDTPSLADEEESGWLERPSMWGKGGPKDCMTCPVGFKIKPLYGDGTGACVACDEGWVDSDTGQITEAGCGGGQFIKLEPGDEPGQVCLCVCVCVRARACCVCMYVCVCVSNMYVHMSAGRQACMYVRTYVCTHTHTHACMHACMYVFALVWISYIPWPCQHVAGNAVGGLCDGCRVSANAGGAAGGRADPGQNPRRYKRNGIFPWVPRRLLSCTDHGSR